MRKLCKLFSRRI